MNKTTKRWLIFLAVAAVVFIVANAINILLIQREPEVPVTNFVQTNVDNSQSTFSNISFTGSNPDFPQSLPVAAAQQYATSEEDIVSVIIDQFNLSPHQEVPELWTSGSWALSKSYDNLYTLSRNQYRPLDTSGMSRDVTLRTAQNFINNYFQQLNLSLVESDVLFYDNILEPDNPGSEQNAQLARVPFSYTIAGYPVFYQQNSLFPFEVWVTAENEVIKLTYYPQFIQLREIGNKPLISIDEAIININQQNLGSIISYTNNSADTVSIEQVSDADLTSVQLEYRVDPSTNLAFPFYRFSGTAPLSGIETEIEITTPAVVVE